MSRAESSWERLVNAALRKDRTGRVAGGPGQSSIVGYVPSSLANNRDIDSILRAADELQDEDPNIARICVSGVYIMVLSLQYELKTGRAKHRGKTSFVEHQTFLHLYHSFHRLWIFLFMMFQALAIIAFNKKSLIYRKTLREILRLGPTFVVMKFSESVLDVIMMYSAYSTTRRLAVSRIFLRFIWFGLASVVISFLYVRALQEDSKPNSDSVLLKLYMIIIAIYGGVHLFFGILMRFPTCHNIANKCDRWPVIRFFKWMRQERHYVGRGMYEKTSDFIKYLLFWLVVLSAKFSFAYFLQIEPLVDPTRVIVKQDNIPYSWHDFVTKKNYNALTVASLWAPVVAIYLLDIHIFYTLVSAFLGFLLGARDRLGEIKSLESIHKQFEEFPGAFMRAPHVPLSNRTFDSSHKTVDKNKVDAAHFAPFWNQIIKSLREEDYVTDLDFQRIDEAFLAPVTKALAPMANITVESSTREARSLAENAFFHPSIMSVSYFSYEHCFAVYSPFFLPVAAHVVLAALREWKRYKQEKAKYLTWIRRKKMV